MELSTIKQIKQQADIFKVINHFTPLKKDGINWRACCPIHGEKSPSFTVNINKNIFKCFGCGKSGDVIDFVMLVNNYKYTEAVNWISNFQSINLDTNYKPVEYIELPTSYIDNNIYKKSIKSDKPNNFTDWLKTVFPTLNIIHPVSTSKHWFGSVTFWYVDINGKIRSGKIMQYNPIDGKRVKDPKPLITWVHKILKIKDFNMKSCLYGENLLPEYPDKIVGIVESEKTAIVASIKYPKVLWIASGSLSNLTYKRCQVLKGRTVYLYPDVGAEERWIEKANDLSELMKDTKFEVHTINSDIKGYDLCDYIIDQINK